MIPATNGLAWVWELGIVVMAIYAIFKQDQPWPAFFAIPLAGGITFVLVLISFGFARQDVLPKQVGDREAEAAAAPVPITTSTVVIAFTSDAAHSQIKTVGIPG
ncbi:hypothetical protein [Cryobacterium sp. MDB2-33-2]|uniref:hypothetical protein n=1 Tax=Cryobacterium sp. MDB2-33-2 TaxID=1259179 RepID=UPI0010690520|nr:hypothetical protein [Cryobacterium sp. MDB2-33-2]TFC09635.1 hypothetical protein E3O59_05200 [Cryobacterium sp. MDB2-33-2]